MAHTSSIIPETFRTALIHTLTVRFFFFFLFINTCTPTHSSGVLNQPIMWQLRNATDHADQTLQVTFTSHQIPRDLK